MKKNILNIIALGAFALLAAACQDAKYGVTDNLLYISETENGKTKSVILESTGISTTISVRLAKAATSEIKVNVAIDPAWLEEYNKSYDASYLCIDDANLSFEKELVIPEGSVSAGPAVLRVAAFDPKGAQYAIPVRITSDDVQVNESSSKIIIALNKPLIQPVPRMRYNNGMQAEGTFPIELPNYTLEWWVKMSGFSVNNQAIFNCGGAASELYCRFGDLVYADEERGSGYKYNFFQVKTMGGQFDSGDPNRSENALVPDTWYHFAISRDSATGQNILYKNGEVVATLTNAPGQNMVCESFQMISSGSYYFRDYCELCQIRLWKTTRSQAQIKKNMNSEVKYDDPDLVIYLPMNEEGSATQHDVTGHGYDVTFGSHPDLNGGSTSVTWSTYEFR